MGAAASELPLPPESVIIFGSFARREADRSSDIDTVIVRPDGIDADVVQGATLDALRVAVRA